jgi:hypothetical protein
MSRPTARAPKHKIRVSVQTKKTKTMELSEDDIVLLIKERFGKEWEVSFCIRNEEFSSSVSAILTISKSIDDTEELEVSL